MNSESFYKLIREKGLGRLSPKEVRSLFHLKQPAYDDVVLFLLADNGEYAQCQPNYRPPDGYQCQIDGCILFALQPNPQLYQQVLASSLLIDDPSSCRDAVAALLQVQSSSQLALDFLEVIDKHASDLNSDQITYRIMSMFYWLGISPEGLTVNQAWPGYLLGVIYTEWFNKNSWSGKKGLKMGYPSTPPSDPVQTQEISLKILQKMLMLFEANNANQTARSIIAQLPLPDKEYLLPLRERIVRAFISANTSSDEYVRHRVSNSEHQAYILS